MIIETIPGGISGAVLQQALGQAIRQGGGQGSATSGIGDAGYKEVTSGSAGIVFAKGSRLVILGTSSSTRTGAAMDPDVQNFAKQVANQL